MYFNTVVSPDFNAWIKVAREAIDRAIALHEATGWPSSEDYHAL